MEQQCKRKVQTNSKHIEDLRKLGSICFADLDFESRCIEEGLSYRIELLEEMLLPNKIGYPILTYVTETRTDPSRSRRFLRRIE